MIKVGIYKYLKRFIDFIMSLFLIVFLSPIILIVSILIKLTSKGPVLFKQERTGKDGKNFFVYKFRSMHVDNDVLDFTEEDRTTPIGKFIRKTSLDEIPQLINILKGEMSFIGPRPWITEYAKYFTKQQMRRLEVRPGLTGYAQCMGRNGISVIQKINYDIEYVDNFSLVMDLKIIFLTLYTVLMAKNAEGNKNIIKQEIEDLKVQKVENGFKKKSKKKVASKKNKMKVLDYEKSLV